MKKLKQLLLAAGLLAVSVPALAVNTEFYGTLREFLEVDNIKGGPTDYSNQGVKLTSFISKVGFRITEPLNDIQPGLKLSAMIETAYYPDAPTENTDSTPASMNRGTKIGNERATVGFYNDDYSLEFGRKSHATWDMLKKYTAFNDLFGTSAGEIHARQGLRFNNAMYTSYKILPGLTLGYQHRFSESSTVDASHAGTVHYESGNWQVSGLYYTDPTNNNSTKGVGSSYKWGDVTGLLLVTRDEVRGVETTGTSVGANYRLTEKAQLDAGYSHRNDGVDSVYVGARYKLSKNVSLIGRINKTQSDNVIAFTASNDLLGTYTGTDRLNAGIGLHIDF